MNRQDTTTEGKASVLPVDIEAVESVAFEEIDFAIGAPLESSIDVPHWRLEAPTSDRPRVIRMLQNGGNKENTVVGKKIAWQGDWIFYSKKLHREIEKGESYVCLTSDVRPNTSQDVSMKGAKQSPFFFELEPRSRAPFHATTDNQLEYEMKRILTEENLPSLYEKRQYCWPLKR